MIGIIDYGMGNIASVKNAFDYLGIPSSLINSPKEFKKVNKLVLPGVGAFGQAMNNLKKLQLDIQLKEDVLDQRKPLLGICLGMQLMLSSSSEHGRHEGLNLVNGQVLDFNDKVETLSVPHIGWNEVDISSNSPLGKGLGEGSHSFYFVHSFYCQLDDSTHVSGKTHYEIEFHSMFESDHIFGCQFHPEKSQDKGLLLLKNFHNL